MVDEVLERLAALEQQQRRTADQLRLWRGAAGALLLLGLLLLPLRSGVAQGGGQGNGQAALQARVAALETALANETAARTAADASLQAAIDNIELTPGPHASPRRVSGPDRAWRATAGRGHACNISRADRRSCRRGPAASWRTQP